MPESIKVVNIAGISPVRKDATDRAEMVTQMLLGETAEVLDMTERWLHLRLDFDGYEGWVNRNEMRFLPSAAWDAWEQSPKFRNRYASLIISGPGRPVFVPLGARLTQSHGNLSVPGEVMEPVIPDAGKLTNPLEYARQMLGTPYLWGGRTDVGIDCSGLVQTAFLLSGFAMPRDAWQQHALGCIRTGGFANARPGDLVYFGSEGRITHVGFAEGNGTLLHAQGFVKRENLLYEQRFSNPLPLNSVLFEKCMGVQDTAALLAQIPSTGE
jgi:cell wall-associated NlpC family hydrolase